MATFDYIAKPRLQDGTTLDPVPLYVVATSNVKGPFGIVERIGVEQRYDPDDNGVCTAHLTAPGNGYSPAQWNYKARLGNGGPWSTFGAAAAGTTVYHSVVTTPGTPPPDYEARLAAVEQLDDVTDLGTWTDNDTLPGVGSYKITLAADLTIGLPTATNAPVLLWLEPDTGSRVATINGTALTITGLTPIALQYVSDNDGWVRLSTPGASSGGGGGTVTEDPNDPGTFVITSNALTEDPDDAGTYLIGDAA